MASPRPRVHHDLVIVPCIGPGPGGQPTCWGQPCLGSCMGSAAGVWLWPEESLWLADLHVGITKRLKTVEVLEGDSCSFECVLSHESAGDLAMWTVGGKTVGSSGHFRAARQGRKYTLTIQEAALSDAGEVVFSVRGLTSKASLVVKGECDEPSWGLVTRGPQAAEPETLSRWSGVVEGLTPALSELSFKGCGGIEAPAGPGRDSGPLRGSL